MQILLPAYDLCILLVTILKSVRDESIRNKCAVMNRCASKVLVEGVVVHRRLHV